MKIARKVLALALMVTLLMTVAAPAFARGSYLGTLRVVNCRDWVTLRSRPSTSAGTVDRVPLGARVEAYYYNSQFTECYYAGQHGYILSTYLSNGSSQSSSSSSSSYLGKKYIVNCREFVTLRRYASTSAPTVTKVALGQVVDAYYYNGTFCRCFYNGQEGYILSQYLGSYPDYSYDEDDYMEPQPLGYTRGESLGTMRVAHCDSWVTLRRNPSTSASTVTRVPKGAKVSAYYYNSEFAECYYNGQHGYILLRYLD